MNQTHNLKTWPEHFQAIKSGDKKAELRKNDRAFQVGDTLVLEEYEPGGAPHYTGDNLKTTVTHILHGPAFGLADGFVVISIAFAY